MAVAVIVFSFERYLFIVLFAFQPYFLDYSEQLNSLEVFEVKIELQ